MWIAVLGQNVHLADSFLIYLPSAVIIPDRQENQGIKRN